MNSAPKFKSSSAGEQPIWRDDADRKGGREPTPRSACTAATVSPAMNWEEALAEAWTQAATMLEELAEVGRYPRGLTEQDQEADRLRMALAFLRAKRKGFEDGVASLSQRGQVVNGHRPPPGRGEPSERRSPEA